MDPLKAKKKISKLLEAAKAEHRENKLTAALTKYKKVLKISENHSDALHLTGLAYYQLEKFSNAISFIKKAIKADDSNYQYWDSLGMVLFDQKTKPTTTKELSNIVKENCKNTASSSINAIYAPNLIEAEKAYAKSVSLNPNNYISLYKLGSIQRIIDKPSKAIESLNKAISINNQHKESIDELGLVYFNLGEFLKAYEEFDKAIDIDKNYIKAKTDKSLAQLSDGKFLDGWQGYEERGQLFTRRADSYDELRRIPYLPTDYTNSPPPLIIFPEQGIGDEIMFASLIPELINNYPGDITLICTSRLVPLFQRSFPNICVSNIHKIPVKNNQHKLFIGSLPKILRNHESDFRSSGAYLINEKTSHNHFINKYKEIKKLKIGISWRSGNPLEGSRRSAALSQLEEVFKIPNCSFFNLQYGDIKNEISEFTSETGINIINDDEIDPLENLDTYISFLSTLDLIITVDNSTAHIGGALGIPTWVLLPFACDWRWMRDRKDCLWYKSLRLYRQKEIGDWSNVIEEVAKDLAERNIQPRAESKPPAITKQETKEHRQPVEKSSEEKNQKTIAFLNDTSEWYHWGCTATSSAIRKRFAEHGFGGIYVPINHTYNFKPFPQTLEQFEDVDFFKQAFSANMHIYNAIEVADCIVINGEGSIHHLSPVSLTLLYIAFAAKKFKNKPVHIINHSPYPDNIREARDDFAFQLYRSIYNQLDYVAIREHISHKLMTDYGTHAELSFDCLPITVTEDYKPENLDPQKNIVISGSVSFTKERIADLEKLMIHFSQKGYRIKILLGAKAFPAQDDVNFVQEILKLKFKGFEVIDAKSLTEWLDCLNSAAVFVSGRFHHSLAAIYLETPCVMMESNTFKNVAVAETFNMPEPIQFSSDSFFEELLERTEQAIVSDPVDADLRKKMVARSEVNFAGLKELK